MLREQLASMLAQRLGTFRQGGHGGIERPPRPRLCRPNCSWAEWVPAAIERC
jgi:hypothetical protein